MCFRLSNVSKCTVTLRNGEQRVWCEVGVCHKWQPSTEHIHITFTEHIHITFTSHSHSQVKLLDTLIHSFIHMFTTRTCPRYTHNCTCTTVTSHITKIHYKVTVLYNVTLTTTHSEHVLYNIRCNECKLQTWLHVYPTFLDVLTHLYYVVITCYLVCS